jgi:tetratricopeptide (TPR) repeat protein
MSLDSHWDLKALHATNPTIYITPDKNTEFELLISDTTLALDIDPLSESIEAAAKETEKDFEDFKKGLVKAADKYADLYNLAAYAYWIGLYDNGLACFNKMNDQKFYSLEVPVSALALPMLRRLLRFCWHSLRTSPPWGLFRTGLTAWLS